MITLDNTAEAANTRHIPPLSAIMANMLYISVILSSLEKSG